MKKFLSTAGFIDPVSLITLGFLVVGLVVTTAIVKNPDISLDIRNYAKAKLEPEEEAFLKKHIKNNIKTSNVANPPANNSNSQPRERTQRDDEVKDDPSTSTVVAPPVVAPPPTTIKTDEQIEEDFLRNNLRNKQTTSAPTTISPTSAPPIKTDDEIEQEFMEKRQRTVAQSSTQTTLTPKPSTNPFTNITAGAGGGTIPKETEPIPPPKTVVPPTAVNPRTGQPLTPTKAPTPTSNAPTPPGEPVKKEEHFPVGIYYSANSSLTQAPPYSQESFNYLSQKGITDLILQNTGGSPQELLNFAKKSDLNVTLDLNFLLDKNGQLNQSVTSQIAQSSNLTSWYGLDEPTNNKTNSPLFPNNQNNLYNNLNKIAPDKPITTVYLPTIGWSDIPDNTEYLQPAIDFAKQFNQATNTHTIGVDPYYWSSGSNDDQVYQNVSNVVQRTNSGQLGSTPEQVIAVLSAHSDLPRLQESFNYQATSAVVAGAAGVYYWDWPPGCNEINCPGFKGDPSQTGYSTHIDKISNVANNLTAVENGITGNVYFLNQNDEITYRLNQADNGQVYAFAISNSGDITPSYADSDTPLINQNQLNQIQQNSLTQTTLFGLPPNTNFDIVGSKENITSNNYGQLNLDAYVMANYILKEANLQPPSFNFNFPFLSVFCLYNPADSRCY